MPSSSSEIHPVQGSSVLPPPGEHALFLRACLRAPLRIASVIPSSPAIGRTFVLLIDLDREGHILELGSGTGPISQALFDAGIPPDRVVLVERDPELASYLRSRFPAGRVVQGNAAQISAILDAENVKRLAVVVSSLPITWCPRHTQADLLGGCFDALGQGGCFLQLTNQPAPPIAAKKHGLYGKRVAALWRNLPPSFIWSYQRL
jgi:phosphatidylethanolamine/phosphatidyl-N-methylethanolamine N-methyltransferase